MGTIAICPLHLLYFGHRRIWRAFYGHNSDECPGYIIDGEAKPTISQLNTITTL
ncbi:hypothetical protein BGP_2789 [Beggiatoa sp. PS]|nr:hypothetical protein BGP_2789 [Beggiatoa sp. PS]